MTLFSLEGFSNFVRETADKEYGTYNYRWFLERRSESEEYERVLDYILLRDKVLFRALRDRQDELSLQENFKAVEFALFTENFKSDLMIDFCERLVRSYEIDKPSQIEMTAAGRKLLVFIGSYIIKCLKEE